MKFISLLIFFLLTIQFLYGQENKFQFGFSFNFLSSANKIDVTNNSAFTSIKNENRFGFELGSSLKYDFNDRIFLRMNPVVGFEKHLIIYQQLGSDEELQFQPAYLKLPLHIAFKLSNKLPIRIVSGLTPSIKLPDSENEPLDKLKLKSSDFSIDLGINYSINFKAFILCPEFRFTKSIINAAGDNRTEYGQGLATYYRDKFTFGLYFY